MVSEILRVGLLSTIKFELPFLRKMLSPAFKIFLTSSLSTALL